MTEDIDIFPSLCSIFLSRLNRSISRLFTSTFFDECAFKGAYVMLLVPHYLVKIKEELKLKLRIFNHFLSILGNIKLICQRKIKHDHFSVISGH